MSRADARGLAAFITIAMTIGGIAGASVHGIGSPWVLVWALGALMLLVLIGAGIALALSAGPAGFGGGG